MQSFERGCRLELSPANESREGDSGQDSELDFGLATDKMKES